ncbi:MAG: hypothetical protein K8E66_02330 [Phycisphaerales bacterium]|nr:hypothetical protein [Phycisphaerales bacterium]
MRVHLVQMNIDWEDRHQNFTRVDRLADATRINPGDLVILPEMFDSGFSLHTDTTRDTDNETRGFLESFARKHKCTIHGGRTVRPDNEDKATNRATVIAPDGRLLADYAKIHPFSFGREPEAFRGGDEVTTYIWRGSDEDSLTVCPAICYDIRFPELFRLGMLLGAEAYAIGANFPAARQEHWRALLLARAIENQAFVFAVNRTGDDPHLHYAGGSIVVGPRGEILGEMGDEEAVLSVEVDPGSVRAWRQAFMAWRDVRLIESPIEPGGART